MNKYFVVIFVALLLAYSSEALKEEHEHEHEHEHEQEQEKCNIMCPANYDPECGFNGNCYKHFGNECMLKAHACHTRQDIKKVELNKCDDPKTRCPDEE